MQSNASVVGAGPRACPAPRAATGGRPYMYHMDLRQFHITRDIKNTKDALQVLSASLRGTFLASIWSQISIKSAANRRGISGDSY